MGLRLEDIITKLETQTKGFDVMCVIFLKVVMEVVARNIYLNKVIFIPI